MQTFLPYESFEDSAKVLDRRRLNKQRIEAWQIYQALVNPNYGWQHHPAVAMWRGHTNWLLLYGITMCQQWDEIGGRDNVHLKDKFLAKLSSFEQKPKWLGDYEFHKSHQSNLLRKDPIYYGHFFPNVPNDLPYIWP